MYDLHKSIRIDPDVHAAIKKIQEEHNLPTMNEAVRYLLGMKVNNG